MAESHTQPGRDTSREIVSHHRDMVGPSLEAPCRAVEEGSWDQPPDLLRIFKDPEVQEFLQANRYQNTLWCSKESLESLIAWLGIICIRRELDPESGELLEKYLEAAEKSGYRFQELLDMMHEQRSFRS